MTCKNVHLLQGLMCHVLRDLLTITEMQNITSLIRYCNSAVQTEVSALHVLHCDSPALRHVCQTPTSPAEEMGFLTLM